MKSLQVRAPKKPLTDHARASGRAAPNRCGMVFAGVRGAPLPTDLVFGSMPPNVVVRCPVIALYGFCVLTVIRRGSCCHRISVGIPPPVAQCRCVPAPSCFLRARMTCDHAPQGSPSGATPPQQPPPRQNAGPGGPQHAAPAGGVQVLSQP